MDTPETDRILDCFVALPCFRESRRLPGFLLQMCEALAKSSLRVAVQVVDDGSEPEELELTRKVTDEARAKYPFVRDLLALGRNRGKGMAIREGWNVAPRRCRCLVFVDADGAVSSEGLIAVIREAISGESKQMVIASRRVPGSKVVRFWHRRLMSWLFSSVTRLTYGLQVRDTQCGCKALPKDFYDSIRDQLRQERYGLDIELLLRARACDLPVEEIAVPWTEQADSKLSLMSVLSLFASVLLKRI